MKTICSLIGVVFLTFGCAYDPHWELEHLVVAEASGLHAWKLLRYDNFKNDHGFARYYVPDKGKDSLSSWSEFITVGFQKGDQISIKEYVQTDISRLNTRCPGIKHQEIKSDTYNVYYMRTHPPCATQKSGSEITRLILGGDGLHRLSYSVKDRELTSAEKEKWLTILQNSFVAKGEKHEKVR